MDFSQVDNFLSQFEDETHVQTTEHMLRSENVGSVDLPTESESDEHDALADILNFDSEHEESLSSFSFDVHEMRLQDLQKKITKLNKIALKLKLPEVQLIFNSDKMVERCENGVKTGAYDKWFNVTIRGPQEYRTEGWKFCGIIDHLPHGNVFRMMKGYDLEDMPHSYRTGNAFHCDQCGHKRYRKATFVCQDVNNESFIRVGSTCLKDFVGHGDVQKVLNFFSKLKKTFNDKKEWSGSYELQYHWLNLNSFLLHCARCIDKEGYINAERAYETRRMTTATHALDNMFGSAENVNLVPHEQTVNRALHWIRNLDVQEDSNYLHNLKTVCSSEQFEFKHTNIAASLVPAYNNAHRVKTRIAKRNVHLGQVGMKIGEGLPPMRVQCIDIYKKKKTGYHGEYILNILKFIDEWGYELTYFCNGNKADIFEKDGEYVITSALINKHSTYHNSKQTIIAHVEIQECE